MKLPRTAPSHPSFRTLAAAAVVTTAAVAIPATAQAAESFVGVSAGNRLVHMQSDTLPGLSGRAVVGGLPAGEKLRALEATPDGQLLAVGSSSAIYTIDQKTSKATQRFAAVTAPLDAGTVTFAVAPDGKTARLLNAVRDLTINMTTGAVTINPDQPAPIAADYLSDGRLLGVNTASDQLVGDSLAGFAATGPFGVPLSAPTSITTASDGRQWILTGLNLGAKHTPKQSQLVRYDPSTGVVSRGRYMYSQLDALAATGVVPDDTKAPIASVRIPRQTLSRVLRNHGVLAIVKTNEPGQTVMSTRISGLAQGGFGLGNPEYAGSFRVVAWMPLAKLRHAAGQRVRIHIAVHDFAHHTKTFDRVVRIARG